MLSISFVVHKYDSFSKPNVGGASKNPIKIIKSLNPFVLIEDVIYFYGDRLGNGQPSFYLYKVIFVKLFLKTIIKNILIIPQLIKSFRNSNIIQIHHPHYGLSAVLLKKYFFKQKIIIIKAHGTSIPELSANQYKGFKGFVLRLDSLIHLKIDRYVLRNADKVVCSSKFQLIEMQKIYGVISKKLICIYNGFDQDYVLKTNTSSPLQFVFCGRIVPKKNITYAIDLFNIIQSKHVDYKLKLILGESNKIEDLRTYKNIIEKVNKNPNIEILFDLSESDLYKVFMDSSIGLITSIGYESIPTVLFEMLGCGVKVFSTYKWGIPEIIEEDSALTMNLSSDSRLIEKFILNGINDFNNFKNDYNQFYISTLAREYLKMYNQLLK